MEVGFGQSIGRPGVFIAAPWTRGWRLAVGVLLFLWKIRESGALTRRRLCRLGRRFEWM